MKNQNSTSDRNPQPIASTPAPEEGAFLYAKNGAAETVAPHVLPHVANKSPKSPNSAEFASTCGNDTANLAPCGSKPTHWIKTYLSHGIRYWGYSYLANSNDIRTIKRLHIPGGNWKNPKAEARAIEVKRWINKGRSPAQIVKLIKSWNRRGKTVTR